MIEYAREAPGQQRRNICTNGLGLLRITAQPPSTVLTSAGVTVSSDMVTVPARVVAFPSIKYAGKAFNPVQVNGKVQWNLSEPGRQFLELGIGNLARNILVLVPVRTPNQDYDARTTVNFARECVQHLGAAMAKYGGDQSELDLTAASFTPIPRISTTSDNKNYESDFWNIIMEETQKARPPNLVVLFTPSKNGSVDMFADFKRVSETEFGMHSLCLAAQSAHGQKHFIPQHERKNPYPQSINRLGQYMGNVSMKLNLKFGHTNHGVELPSGIKSELFITATTPEGTENELIDTIILGADVTHLLQGGLGPSITAIVGSIDDHFGQYVGSVRYQQSRKEVRVFSQDLCTPADLDYRSSMTLRTW